MLGFVLLHEQGDILAQHIECTSTVLDARKVEATKDTHPLFADRLGRGWSLATLLHINGVLVRLTTHHCDTQVMCLLGRTSRIVETDCLDLRRIVRADGRSDAVLERFVNLYAALHEHVVPEVWEISLQCRPQLTQELSACAVLRHELIRV